MQVDMIPGQGNIAQESCLDRTTIMKGIIYWISNVQADEKSSFTIVLSIL